MARAARAALADARAMEEQNLRQQMHGGAFYGAGMRVGGSATPSMGLSQFRGGKHCNSCGCSPCECSSSDEEHQGGGIYSSIASAVGRFGSTTASRAAAAAEAARVAAAEERAAAAAAAALSTGRAALTNAPVSTLALRPTGVLAVRPGLGAYDAALDLRGLSGSKGAANSTIASRLAAMGVTPARLAAALAAGVGLTSLEAYFASAGTQFPGGNYDMFPPPGPGSGGPGTGGPGSGGPGTGGPGSGGPGTGGPGTGGPGSGGPGTVDVPAALKPNTPKRVVAAYLRSGNAPSRYLVGNQAQKEALARSEGALTGGGRSARGQAVKAIMSKHGLSLPEASRYLKQHGSA